jgi:hypothetical protein
MARVITTLGSMDFDQTDQELNDRIVASKSGFIYVTAEGNGRNFNKDHIVYILQDYTPIESTPQTPIDHSVPDVEIDGIQAEPK